MIPKVIHYCWFGRGPKSALNDRCMDTWHKVLPDYEIKEWNETNSPLDNEYCKSAFAAKSWSRLSNHVRLHALYTEGGIYLDTDVELIKSFSPLLHYRCFLGFQVEEEQTDWVNTAVLGSEAGNEFLKRGMDLTLKLFAQTGEFYRSPAVTTMILREMGLEKYGLQEIQGVTICPTEYFYPFPWTGTFSPDCIRENTYSVHHWERTWWPRQSRLAPLNPLRLLKRIVRALILRVR